MPSGIHQWMRGRGFSLKVLSLKGHQWQSVHFSQTFLFLFCMLLSVKSPYPIIKRYKHNILPPKHCVTVITFLLYFLGIFMGVALFAFDPEASVVWAVHFWKQMWISKQECTIVCFTRISSHVFHHLYHFRC